MNSLQHFDAARRELELAASIDEVKDIRDKAAALAAYARQQRDSLQMQQWAAEIKLRAERKAGEMLSEVPRDGAGRPADNSENDFRNLTPYQQALQTANVSHVTAQNWRKIATIPEPEFEAHIAGAKANEVELTTAGALRLAKERQSEPPKWDDSQKERRSRVEAGETVLANIRDDEALIEWATERGLYVRIDRYTIWGNPFILGADGTRSEVIESFRWYYKRKPSLWDRIGELKGKVLGCWCYPEPCHGDHLMWKANVAKVE